MIAESAFSQITITGANLPQSGYTYFTATDTTPSVSLGIPGPGSQLWNFSSLLMDYPSMPTYGYTSWTPYASAFPTSNIYTYGPAALYSSLFGGAPVNSQGMNKGHMFWKCDNSGFFAVGFRADSGTYANVNVNYNPAELLIGAPCTYGNSFNNTGRWELPMNVNPSDVDTFYVCRTVKTITCDAWGSLTTPFGTFPDVIRQHEYVIRYDSAYAKLGNTVITSMELMRDTSNNYIYLSNTLSYPASIIHADANNNIKDAEWYIGVATGVSDIPVQENKINIFPNPVSSVATIEYLLDKPDEVEVQLQNALGKVFSILPKQKLSSGKHSIPLLTKDLSPGVYFVSIYKTGAVSVYKIVVSGKN